MKQAWLYTEQELTEELVKNGFAFYETANEDDDDDKECDGLIKIDRNTTIAIEIANSQAVCFTVNDFENETFYILTENGLTKVCDMKNGFIDIIENHFMNLDIINISENFEIAIVNETEDNFSESEPCWHIVYNDDMSERLSVARIYKK